MKTLKHFFTHNFQSLEIDKIEKIQLRGNNTPEYQNIISWFGFDSQSNSWEPLDDTYRDFPLLLHTFVNKMRNNYRKDAILVYLCRLDNNSSEEETVLRLTSTVNYKSKTFFSLDEN
eukprot:snap_masked-scaffold_28-processed-gene-4.71-mRNA-1 protein AED:1.00 eAED:1.00 QI:0/-1/0/0/-1/1/1/0/116